MTAGRRSGGGPRCPTCQSVLEGHVGYRVLAVRPVDTDSESESLDVVFVYCLRCQFVIATFLGPPTPMKPCRPAALPNQIGSRLQGGETRNASSPKESPTMTCIGRYVPAEMTRAIPPCSESKTNLASSQAAVWRPKAVER
jgi:hypothetical protein